MRIFETKNLVYLNSYSKKGTILLLAELTRFFVDVFPY